jgi:hypothetical protein
MASGSDHVWSIKAVTSLNPCLWWALNNASPNLLHEQQKADLCILTRRHSHVLPPAL